ncbi:MAG: formylglycine-generating enzyme family protein [Sphingorhabdus sp.]
MRTIYISALCLPLLGCNQSDILEEPAISARSCDTKMLGTTISIPAGTFTMGASPQYREEGPPRTIAVEAFRIDTHEVTNAQYAEFVDATGYVTEAEKSPPGADKLPPDMREPGSAVFIEPKQPGQQWWIWTTGADWRHPTGPNSTIDGKPANPAVHISYNDAKAYADWKGGALPSEEQWEYAARAGSPDSNAPLDAQGNIEANHYQGAFPAKDLGTDGFVGSAPAGCYKPNGFDLYDMIGNVWEWTESSAETQSRTTAIKGGSYLCAENYCARYRPSARQFQEKDLGTNHVGFRLVYPVES